MHVLLVEDDSVLADGIARVLRSHGMVVDMVSNGSDVEAALNRSEVAVLVMDIGLPGNDGALNKVLQTGR
jgi:two-component system OmpR family response regulator